MDKRLKTMGKRKPNKEPLAANNKTKVEKYHKLLDPSTGKGANTIVVGMNVHLENIYC
jgi:hypothetical protein